MLLLERASVWRLMLWVCVRGCGAFVPPTGFTHRSLFASALYAPAALSLLFAVGCLILCVLQHRSHRAHFSFDGVAVITPVPAPAPAPASAVALTAAAKSPFPAVPDDEEYV